jgi:rod shape-determining protein MreC
MRGRFSLVLFLSGLVVITLAAFNSLVIEQHSLGCFVSHLSYPVVFLNYKTMSLIDSYTKCFNKYFNQPDWQIKNNRLQEHILDLQAQNISLQAQAVYWQEHQELIEFHKRYNFTNNILAQVFLKNLGAQEHYMLLDKGLADGVQVGMVAIYKNCLLGKVVAAYPKYSRLALLTDKTCRVAVYDEKTGAVGICCGQNDTQQILLSYVSHLQKIMPDDLLISSGEGEVFPQGFGVGKIVDACSAGMYYHAHASLLFDLDTISSCYLVAANKT